MQALGGVASMLSGWLEADGLRREVAAHRALRRRNDEFVDKIAHRLKTPLMWVLGCAELLSRLEVPDDTRTMALRQIAQGSHEMRAIIDSLWLGEESPVE